MSWILAIDPGPEQSAALRYDAASHKVDCIGILPNETLLRSLEPIGRHKTHLAIEMIACYGMPVGSEVFETCVWIGRFLQRWEGPYTRVYRREVKLHLCNSARAKDANVRQALIDRFGPGKKRAIGLKASPGPLFGIKADLWAALGVAVTFADRKG
jgi:hypothetical protein